MARIEAICYSNRGLRRPHNEDNFVFCGKLRDTDPEADSVHLYEKRLKRSWRVVGVFDGMGGMKHGEEASRAAADSFLACPEDIRSAEELAQRCKTVNHLIQKQNQASGEESGTTAALIGFGFREAAICHVGDSRVYRKHGDALEQLTKDHTDKLLLDAMGITVRQPRLLQYLGMDKEIRVEPGVVTVALKAGDLYLCCTDGLYSMISESDLSMLLDQRLSLGEIGEKLMNTALQAGGTDNITFILCRVKYGF